MKVLQDSDNDSPTNQDDIKSNSSVPLDQDIWCTQWLIRLKTQKEFTGSKIGAIFRKITSRVTTKKLKIGQWALFELGPFFSLFLMRKTLSSGQKWFLWPYFPLIRGMFQLRSGLDFRFGHWKCPNREWGKGHISSERGLFFTLYLRDAFKNVLADFVH